jgi:transcriptional regulator with XRE-family HTH domain
LDAAEFKDWREGLGLTQRQAAEELGVAPLTVQKYERGFRHDTGKPVRIPARVALACAEITRRLRANRVGRLPYKKVPPAIMERVSAFLASQKIGIGLEPALLFHAEHYAPFVQIIDEWLAEHAHEKGYLKMLVPDAEAAGGAVVALHFFDPHDAISFAFAFGGRAMEP